MDIIILAAIAIFIFAKLISQLGRVDEDQKRDAIRNFVKEQTLQNQLENKVIIAKDDGKNMVAAVVDEKNQKILDAIPAYIRSDVIIVFGKAKISPSDFITGANMAFEMVLDAFAKGDVDALKMLLSDKIYNQFDLVIKDRKANNQVLNTKIFMIEKTEITAAKMIDNFAIVTVNFISKQINYITDLSGTVIEGSKEEINNVADSWTFRKDINSPNPNWIVISTDVSA